MLGVVNLKQIELATEEDKLYGINRWAKLFKAKTWEEIKMVMEKTKKRISGMEDEILENLKKDKDLEKQIDACLMAAAESIYRFNADPNVRKRCQDREEYYRDIRNFKKEIASQKRKISLRDKKISEMEKEIEELKKKLGGLTDKE